MGNVRKEYFFREKRAYLQVRVDPLCEPPEKLQNEAVCINKGCIPLFGPHQRGF
jgi:hypothetical protein